MILFNAEVMHQDEKWTWDDKLCTVLCACLSQWNITELIRHKRTCVLMPQQSEEKQNTGQSSKISSSLPNLTRNETLKYPNALFSRLLEYYIHPSLAVKTSMA